MLGFDYLDTGAMYRMAALLCARNGCGSDGGAPAALIESHSISLHNGEAFLDGENVSACIRTPAISEAASLLSALPGVRRAMVLKQREFASGRDLVAEGRDMGTVVFPDASLKVYVIADLAVRAVRRLRDQGPGSAGEEDFASVVLSLIKRDRRDRERSDSPLRPAPDAVLLDTSLMTVAEQVEKVVSLYEAVRGRRRDVV